MLTVYDKAQWHIDGGEDKCEVIARFNEIFKFLEEHDLLSDDGKEIFKLGVDSSISINEGLVTKEGELFLRKYYDSVISYKACEIGSALEERLDKFRLNDGV